MLILQSASLRVGAFNDYLNWILQDATEQFSKDNRLELLCDDPPIKAVTADGQIFSGNQLRLKKPVSIQVDGKIPVPGDVFEQMQKYLAELLERGDISAN